MSDQIAENEVQEMDGEERIAGMQWVHFRRYPYLLAKLVFFAALIAGLYWVLQQVSAVIFPLFMALLLAYILNPTVGMLEKKGIPRPLGILLIIIGLLGFVFVFSLFLYPTIADQIRKIGERAPQVWEVIEEQTIPWIADTLGLQIPATLAEILEEYGEEISDAVPLVAENIGDWLGEAVTRTQVILVSLFNLVMIPIFTFYFLRDFERGKERLERFVPPARRDVWYDRLRRMDFAVGQWFRGQLQVAGILAVLYGIALGLVYWLTGHDPQSGVVIGLLTGFLNVIPYLGFAIGSLLAFMVIIIDWTGWWAFIGVTLAFTIIQTVESYYITPRVMGDKVGMTPVAVIIVLLIGGHVAGLLGVLLAIPLAGAVKVLLPDMAAWYRRTTFYSGQAVHPAVAMRKNQNNNKYENGGHGGAQAEMPDIEEVAQGEPDLEEEEKPENEEASQAPQRPEEDVSEAEDRSGDDEDSEEDGKSSTE